jgi:hypothetical protein
MKGKERKVENEQRRKEAEAKKSQNTTESKVSSAAVLSPAENQGNGAIAK